MAAKEKTLQDLFQETLKDIYHAEKQILKALPKMAKAANSDQLRQAFEKHRTETEGQVERLEKIFEIIGKPARAKPCEAIKGLVEEGKEVMEDFKDSAALDAGLRAGRRALRDLSLWDHEGVGPTTRNERGGQAARPDPSGGEEDRRGAHPPR